MSIGITSARRLSVEKDDAGAYNYRALCNANKYVKVFLDGVEQQNVITADADDGIIKRYCSVDEIKNGHWPVETVRGTVTFEISEISGAPQSKEFEHQS